MRKNITNNSLASWTTTLSNPSVRSPLTPLLLPHQWPVPIIAVAGSFAGADDALRLYAISIEAWQEELRALKDFEDEVGNVIRDREILFVHFSSLFPHCIAFLRFSLRQIFRAQRDASHQTFQVPETHDA